MAHLNTAVEKDSRLAPMYTPLTQARAAPGHGGD